MQNSNSAGITVRCDCGRDMRAVGNAASGTFTCGCGHGVAITIPEQQPGCIALSETGRRCGGPPIREAVQLLNLTICKDHLLTYARVVQTLRDADAAMWWVQEKERVLGDHYPLLVAPLMPETQRRLEQARELYAEQSVVYYVRIGDNIKIGTTIHMQNRMRDLLPDEILATEPGGPELERMRHKQFAALKAGHRSRERFRAEEPLLSHIAMIRGHFGEPQITGYVVDAEGNELTPDGEIRPRLEAITTAGRRRYMSAARKRRYVEQEAWEAAQRGLPDLNSPHGT